MKTSKFTSLESLRNFEPSVPAKPDRGTAILYREILQASIVLPPAVRGKQEIIDMCQSALARRIRDKKRIESIIIKITRDLNTAEEKGDAGWQGNLGFDRLPEELYEELRLLMYTRIRCLTAVHLLRSAVDVGVTGVLAQKRKKGSERQMQMALECVGGYRCNFRRLG